MAAPFQGLVEMATNTVDGVMSETVEIHPWRAGNSRDSAGADPARPIATTIGVIRAHSGQADRGDHRGAQWIGDVEADFLVLHIAHQNAPDYDLEDGDRVIATDRPGPPVFEVARGDEHMVSRLRYRLTPLGVSSDPVGNPAGAP